MSQAVHEHQDPEPRPALLYPTPLRDLIRDERERLAQLVETSTAEASAIEAVPLADDPTSAYVAELVAVAPPLSADLRATLAGLLNTEP
jgi:hypothetical protein